MRSENEQDILTVDFKRRLEVLENRASNRLKVPSLGNWQAPVFQNGWTHYGVDWEPVEYARDNSGFVHIRGCATTGSLGMAIFTLPEGYRPDHQIWGMVATAGQVSAMRIYTTGEVVVEPVGIANNSIVGLGFVFPTDAAEGFPIGIVGTPISRYSTIQDGPTANYHRSGFMVGSGIGTGGNNVQEAVGIIPSNLTSQRFCTIHTIGSGGVFSRMDMRPGGLWFVAGVSQILSYCDVVWPTYEVKDWTTLPLITGWTAYPNGYHGAPEFHVGKDGWVHFRGLAQPGTTTAGTIIAQLPLGSEPRLNSYHRVIASDTSFPISVRGNGDIVLEQNHPGGWLALDSLKFHLS